jgi:hypothetical protein
MAQIAAGGVQVRKLKRKLFDARLLAIAALVITSSIAQAQVPPGGAPPAGRGGGRGRGGVQVMTLTTTAFADGGVIPTKYTQVGEEASPPLAWTGAPDSTSSFVLIVHDPNAATGNGLDDILHWMVWNIPGSSRSLPEDIPHGASVAGGARQISVSGPYFRGAAAPATGPAHHYVFELYALDTSIDVPAVGQSPAATRAAVVGAMSGHVRGKAVLVGMFKRSPP